MKRYIKSTETTNPDITITVVLRPVEILASEGVDQDATAEAFDEFITTVRDRIDNHSELYWIGQHSSDTPGSLSTYIDCMYTEGRRSYTKSVLVMMRVSDHDESKPYSDNERKRNINKRISKRKQYNKEQFQNYSLKAPQIKDYEYSQIIVDSKTVNETAGDLASGVRLIDKALNNLTLESKQDLHSDNED